jgi:RecB family endonuclease NucS
MLDINLIEFENGWKFASEEDLENFLWDNLDKLLNLQPIKRHFRVLGEICDLLGLDKDGH